MGRIFLWAGLIATGLALTGCGSILGIQVYDQDADNSTNVGSDSSVADQSSPDAASVDAAPDTTTGADAADAAADRVDGFAADAPGADAIDGSLPIDAGAEGGSDARQCTDMCNAGTTRCSSDNGSTQVCQTVASGCTDWVTGTTCGTNRTCVFTSGAASCACNPSICTVVGNVCQDAQTVANCAKDANNCLYVVMPTTNCSAPDSCSGTAPGAMCSPTCANSCTQGQTSCVSGGQANCTLGTNGCYAYGQPMQCGPRQTCSGSAGSGGCACNTDPLCSNLGNVCASSTSYATCAQDGQMCFYQASVTPCAAGKICQGGNCVCPAGSHDCSGTCSSNSSTSSCGPTSCTPCQVPTNGQATCDGTSCGMSCTTGLNVCGSGASAACVNLQTDGTNCGACGHNCQNGGCLNGQCQAAPFATGFTGGPVAVGPDSIYVVDYGSGGRLLRIAKSSGSITPIASGTIFNVAVFGSNVYWTASVGTNNSTVTRAALDGSSPVPIATSQVNAGDIAVDSSGAYWVNAGMAASDGAVMRFGPSDTAPFPFATGLPGPNSIALDANNVYWLTVGAVGDGSDGALYGKPKSGGATFTIASMQHNATGSGEAIATFGGTVFWDPRGLGNTDGAVRSAPPVANATVTEYANNQVRPQTLASDGSFVYWTDFGNGTDGLVQKASLTTKVVTQLAGSLAQPLGLGLDGSVLYFSTFGNSTTSGGLYRLVL